MKYLKSYELYKFQDEITHIINNYDPYVVKYEENKSNKYFSVLIKDKNSNFTSWIDLWIENNQICADWNQMSYDRLNSKDMIKKEVENNPDIYSMSESVAREKLIDDEMIYEDENGYHYYNDYWYVKDGFKKQDISLDDAKKIKKYNL